MIATHPHLTLIERLDRHPLFQVGNESLTAWAERHSHQGKEG